MGLHFSPVPALSGPQRRSHLLLMLFAPLPSLSLVSLSRYNGEDLPTTRRDLVHIEREIRHIHHLALIGQHNGSYRIEGIVLNKRLCLIEGLRRALRLCPERVSRYFEPLQKHQWRHLPIALRIGPDRLNSVIDAFIALLGRPALAGDRYFLQLYFRHILLQCAACEHPEFNQHQWHWLEQKTEHRGVLDIFRDWPLPDNEKAGLTLLARLMKTPSYSGTITEDDRLLTHSVAQLIARFEQVSGMAFHQRDSLARQLFSHLSAALERCHFHMGIDNSLQQELDEKYPRLIRTTRLAVMAFEAHYRIKFAREEIGLIAVIFGAWLMQDNELQEKQVLILTHGENPTEKTLELQIRELTLLPLNIKCQSLAEFQCRGAPKNTDLIISPFSLPLPLYSPPLILVQMPLALSQQERIRHFLES
ncbi:stationary phase inducible protein CsiE [Martelella alba]|uniref:Stationary phase inducible protein CsiE n=1 Tax=Martelella alba TaxID=2590451 RepID=A0ABY2SLZ5_9HYPH|nr:stationary phase inducible protein CsiE [Martelella alba]TKI06760.1 stationary phase inducible protein CsiE [Martelella alba]